VVEVAVLRCCTNALSDRSSAVFLTADPLFANYWRRGQQRLLMQVTWLMTVIASQLKALRLLYFSCCTERRTSP
jgi:hypothetical protein